MISSAWAAVAVAALQAAQPPRQPPTFASGAEVVRLDVLALDRQTPLHGLTSRDFEVRDNGVLQEIRLTRAASLRWEIVLLLDISESVKGPKLDAFRACARAIAGTLREGDRLTVVTFSDAVQLLDATTASAAPLLQGLDDVRGGGGTSLFDALFAALAISGADSARPIVLLFSDGRDTASWLSAEDVVAAARLSEASIYAVSTSSIGALPDPPATLPTWASVAAEADDAFLRRITRETGGRLLRARSVPDVQAQLAAVLDEIGARYLLTYEPAGVAREGWHPVKVRLRSRRGSVVVRPGYYRAR